MYIVVNIRHFITLINIVSAFYCSQRNEKQTNESKYCSIKLHEYQITVI